MFSMAVCKNDVDGISNVRHSQLWLNGAEVIPDNLSPPTTGNA